MQFDSLTIGALVIVAIWAVWMGQSEEDKAKDLEDLYWLANLPRRALIAVLRRLLKL